MVIAHADVSRPEADTVQTTVTKTATWHSFDVTTKAGDATVTTTETTYTTITVNDDATTVNVPTPDGWLPIKDTILTSAVAEAPDAMNTAVVSSTPLAENKKRQVSMSASAPRESEVYCE